MRKYSSISVETTLASTIGATGTTMTVATGTGAGLINGAGFTNGDQFTVAIDPDTTSEEIVFITANSGDSFTVTRGQAGTTAITHGSGATVRHVLTSNDLTYFNATLPATLIEAKGDLIAGSAANAADNLAVGTNGTVLTADSAQTLGVKWASAYPTQTGNSGKFLSTNGTAVSWETVDAFPSQTGNSGKYLTTNGTTTSWGNPSDVSINAQVSTTYTFVAGDTGKLVTFDNVSPIAVTVPTNASVAYATGTQINIAQIGAGQVTIAGDTGVTVNATPGLNLRAQYSGATLVKTDTNSWLLLGDLSA